MQTGIARLPASAQELQIAAMRRSKATNGIRETLCACWVMFDGFAVVDAWRLRENTPPTPLCRNTIIEITSPIFTSAKRSSLLDRLPLRGRETNV
jgi:hypothetical protein